MGKMCITDLMQTKMEYERIHGMHMSCKTVGSASCVPLSCSIAVTGG